MLEDESGRIKLVGDRVKNTGLVTGVIIGALGMETPNGEFEVIDICCAEMAPQPSAEVQGEDKNSMDVDGKASNIVNGNNHLMGSDCRCKLETVR